MLLMVEIKRYQSGICHSIGPYAKANKKYMKDYDKNKRQQYLQWAMLPKLLVNNFDWIENTSQFNEDFIKDYNEESNEGYFLRWMFNILKNYMNLIMIYHFYLKE